MEPNNNLNQANQVSIPLIGENTNNLPMDTDYSGFDYGMKPRSKAGAFFETFGDTLEAGLRAGFVQIPYQSFQYLFDPNFKEFNPIEVASQQAVDSTLKSRGQTMPAPNFAPDELPETQEIAQQIAKDKQMADIGMPMGFDETGTAINEQGGQLNVPLSDAQKLQDVRDFGLREDLGFRYDPSTGVITKGGKGLTSGSYATEKPESQLAPGVVRAIEYGGADVFKRYDPAEQRFIFTDAAGNLFGEDASYDKERFKIQRGAYDSMTPGNPNYGKTAEDLGYEAPRYSPAIPPQTQEQGGAFDNPMTILGQGTLRDGVPENAVPLTPPGYKGGQKVQLTPPGYKGAQKYPSYPGYGQPPSFAEAERNMQPKVSIPLSPTSEPRLIGGPETTIRRDSSIAGGLSKNDFRRIAKAQNPNASRRQISAMAEQMMVEQQQKADTRAIAAQKAQADLLKTQADIAKTQQMTDYYEAATGAKLAPDTDTRSITSVEQEQAIFKDLQPILSKVRSGQELSDADRNKLAVASLMFPTKNEYGVSPIENMFGGAEELRKILGTGTPAPPPPPPPAPSIRSVPVNSKEGKRLIKILEKTNKGLSREDIIKAGINKGYFLPGE